MLAERGAKPDSLVALLESRQPYRVRLVLTSRLALGRITLKPYKWTKFGLLKVLVSPLILIIGTIASATGVGYLNELMHAHPASL